MPVVRSAESPGEGAGGAFVRAVATIDDVMPGERSVVARINSAAVDRFGTVVDPLGADLRSFNANPVVLWQHGFDPNRGTVPIGRGWAKVRRSEKDMLGKTFFGKDDFSQMLFEMYQDGTLKGFSIRGNPDPTKCGRPTPAEVRSRPELADCECIYRAWELVEYSAVAIPGNTDALALAVSRGFWVPDELRAQLAASPTARPDDGSEELGPELELPPLMGRTFEEARQAVIRSARSHRGRGDGAAIARDLLDLQRGRV